MGLGKADTQCYDDKDRGSYQWLQQKADVPEEACKRVKM